VTAYGSVYTLVLMALDRYLAIVHPIGSIDWRTVRKTALVMIITWVTSDALVTYTTFFEFARLLFAERIGIGSNFSVYFSVCIVSSQHPQTSAVSLRSLPYNYFVVNAK